MLGNVDIKINKISLLLSGTHRFKRRYLIIMQNGNHSKRGITAFENSLKGDTEYSCLWNST